MSDIQTLKADYLAEFNRAVPKLKKLATAIRREESKLSTDTEIDEFWAISGDRQTDYQLCQVAADLDDLDEFWGSHPDNKETSPTETAIASKARDISHRLYGL